MVEGGRGTAQPGIDGAVIRRAAAGDREALAVLWRGHQPGLLRYLRGMSVRLADDVASQVWLEAARSLHRFEGGDKDLRRWLFTIARRRMIDAYRVEGRRREEPTARLPEAAAIDPTEDLVDEVTGPASAALRRLAPGQAEIVLLRVVGGFSVDEVAEITGKSPGAVRVTAHRALRRLAGILASEAGADPVTDAASRSMERST
jgi:RNA polymerase sigma-70 factor (ECF subfamily)